MLLLLLACSGGEPPPPTPTSSGSAVPAALLTTTWQVRLADATARAPFEGKEGWVAWFENRRADAVRSFAAAGDAPAEARAHLELAAMYRQAAWMGANAAIEVWGVDAQPTDPAETAYVVGLAGVLVAEPDPTAKLGANTKAADKRLAAQDTAWKAWVDAKAPWPPDAPTAGSPGLPIPDGTPLPDAGPIPHYQVKERTPEALTVDLGDLGTLWALSRWHEARALAGPPEIAAAVPWMLDPWRLPFEPDSGAAPGAVPDALLFMSPYTTAGDAELLAGLTNAPQGREGVVTLLGELAGESPYAVIVAKCLGPERIDADCIADEGAALGRALTDAMAAANGGAAEGFHRPFADYARLGVIIAAERAAGAMMDPTQQGRLRLAALDRAVGNARDPLFLLSLAAWDAGNRYSLRAEDIVHELLPQVPGLDVARFSLDALHVRVSRSAAPGRPMH